MTAKSKAGVLRAGKMVASRVNSAIEFVKAVARIGPVQLQVESRGLDQLLLVTGQACQAVGKTVGNEKFHFLSVVGTLPENMDVPFLAQFAE